MESNKKKIWATLGRLSWMFVDPLGFKVIFGDFFGALIDFPCFSWIFIDFLRFPLPNYSAKLVILCGNAI